jgi:hypothetical protein
VILQADLVDQYDSQTSAYPRPRCKSAGQASVANASSTPNGRDQQIAANGLSTPQDAIAILLHRLVLPAQIHHSLATAH